MEISAGLPSKQDVVVKITDNSTPLNLSISSSVQSLFGSAIEKAASGELERMGVVTGNVTIEDNQALDFVIKARIRAAVTILRKRGSSI